jgi:hypothetical protein
MYELLWFIGGALVYQLLSRMLKIIQIYMFFQEIHVHILMMLKAASHDLDTVVDIKATMMEELDLEEGQMELINSTDKQIVETWRATTIFKLQSFVPNVFKTSVKYHNWDEMKKYLSDVLKK